MCSCSNQRGCELESFVEREGEGHVIKGGGRGKHNYCG